MAEKEQPPSPQDHTRGSHKVPEDEINFLDLLEVLFEKRKLIIIVTFLSLLSSIIYASSITPVYKASVGVVRSDDLKLAQYFHILRGISSSQFRFFVDNSPAAPLQDFALETKNKKRDSLLKSFLVSLRFNKLQEKVFVEGNFLERFSENTLDAKGKDRVLGEISKSLQIDQPGKAGAKSSSGTLFNDTTYVSLEGENPEAISDFLNSLVDMALKDTEISIKQSLQEEIDLQKNVYSVRVKNLRLKEEVEGLEQIQYLSENLEIANNLGILENNLANVKMTLKDIKSDVVEDKLPLWFLYGVRALEQKIAVIKNRETSGLYKKDIAELEVIIKEISKIDPLKSLIPPVIVTQSSTPPTEPISISKFKIVTIGIVVGLLAGLVLAFLVYANEQLRQRSETQFDKK